MQADFLKDARKVNEFVLTVSRPRLFRYLREAGNDEDLALRLYHWNSQLSQSLYLPLQTWEIALRNRINNFLSHKYKPDWHLDHSTYRSLTRKDELRLRDAVDRQRRYRDGHDPTANKVVADLSAGFWVSQLGKSYEIPYSWRNNLKFRVFTNDRHLGRADALEKCEKLLNLRNRIAHHEPIFHLPLDQWKADLDLILQAMCSSTADYMASACSFASIWQAKPSPAI